MINDISPRINHRKLKILEVVRWRGGGVGGGGVREVEGVREREGGGLCENKLASSNLFRCKYFVISTLLHCFHCL